ncbi:DUF3850 domain-containing protein [Chania multitudinisentens]|uniref:DUF3850 domain-containing protein n=1 Tax=Chania multitudinisentens TaxID=1639108 RepID=UPI0003E14262|nr:DUF3850 domain-containing protein [Chania multitudinisentens]
MKKHDLKILPEYFAAVVSGEKKAEIRINDRDYSVGNMLRLNEYGQVKGFDGLVGFSGEFITDKPTEFFVANTLAGMAEGEIKLIPAELIWVNKAPHIVQSLFDQLLREASALLCAYECALKANRNHEASQPQGEE